MNKSDAEEIENQFLAILLDAMKKGMTPEEFFALADSAICHLKGDGKSDIIGKIIEGTATGADADELIDSLGKGL